MPSENFPGGCSKEWLTTNLDLSRSATKWLGTFRVNAQTPSVRAVLTGGHHRLASAPHLHYFLQRMKNVFLIPFYRKGQWSPEDKPPQGHKAWFLTPKAMLPSQAQLLAGWLSFRRVKQDWDPVWVPLLSELGNHLKQSTNPLITSSLGLTLLIYKEMGWCQWRLLTLQSFMLGGKWEKALKSHLAVLGLFLLSQRRTNITLGNQGIILAGPRTVHCMSQRKWPSRSLPRSPHAEPTLSSAIRPRFRHSAPVRAPRPRPRPQEPEPTAAQKPSAHVLLKVQPK